MKRGKEAVIQMIMGSTEETMGKWEGGGKECGKKGGRERRKSKSYNTEDKKLVFILADMEDMCSHLCISHFVLLGRCSG